MARKTNSKTAPDQNQEQRKRHGQRKAWFTAEQQRQAVNRYQMALDEEYKDGIQWTDEEAAAVRARGQNPVVYNEIKPTVDWMIGTERRTRTDFVVTNRTDDTDDAYEDAQVKTKLLKYLDDVNRTPFERSQVAVDCFTAGLGWLETGVRPDPGEEPIFGKYESWRFMLHDSLAPSMNPEDGRYQFRFKELDVDIAEMMFPGQEDLIKKAVQMADRSSLWDWRNGHPWLGMPGTTDGLVPMQYQSFDADAWLAYPRDRVLLLECWEQTPMRDPVTGLMKMRKRVSIQTECDVLLETWSPYKHGKFPFIPHWCYRRKKDGMPYGVVRNLRGPQDTLNKQMSKAVYRMAARQVLLERGAIEDGEGAMDVEEIRDEIADPAGIVTFADGALSGNKVRLENGIPFAEADVKLADYNVQSIRQSSGVGGQQRGLETNVIAAKGILAMQEQGGLLTAEPFDNGRLARQIEGEISLSLIEQYYTEPKTFSIAGEQGRFEFQHINKVDPKTGRLNDVTKRAAAFVIGEQPWKANLAEAAFQQTMELLGQIAPVAPQVVLNILDLVFEFHPSLPNKQAMIQRIRAINGMSDPNGKMTPEQQQQKQQQQQIAQAKFQSEMAQLQADIRAANAKGEKLEADSVLARLTGIYEAAQAAQVLAMAPGLAPIADELLRSSGFKDMTEPQVIQMPAGAAQPALPMPGAPMQSQPMPGHIPPPLQADGAKRGIETMRPDGLDQGVPR